MACALHLALHPLPACRIIAGIRIYISAEGPEPIMCQQGPSLHKYPRQNLFCPWCRHNRNGMSIPELWVYYSSSLSKFLVKF